MTKEKQKADLARSIFYILTALALGSYFGSPASQELGAYFGSPASQALGAYFDSPASQRWTGPVSETVSFVSDQTGTEENISTINGIVSDPGTGESTASLCPGSNRGGAADRKETDVLIHLINAEAFGLSYKAKVAVGQVVMNRWTGPYYGDDLLAIMTAPYQFTPIYDGSAYEKEIEPDSIQAANAVLSGTGVEELTEDTYYFVNPEFTEDKTIEEKMEYVCQIEGIHFYKPPSK